MSDLLGTVNQYVGRTVDYAFLQGDSPAGDVEMVQTLIKDNDGGRVVTGLKSLVQRYVLRLNTIQGTMKFLPLEGTQFLRDAISGRWRTTADVLQSFSAAELAIRRQEQAEDSPEYPDDERYLTSELMSVVLSPGAVSVRIRLTSAAGRSSEFIYPIPLAVIR